MAYVICVLRDEHDKKDFPPETYLKVWDPQAHDGRGHAILTREKYQAKRYETRIEAHREWQAGPLQAYSIIIEPA